MNDNSNDGPPAAERRLATRVVTAGRHPASYHGFVNPPVYHASTVHIGLEAVEDLIADLERGFAAPAANS